MQARFIRIHTGLYLYPCYFILTSIVKNDLSFTAQAVVIMITIQKWKKKKERKSTLPFSKIRSRENFRCGRYHKTSKAFSNVHGVKNFYLNKTDVIITVNTSKVFRVYSTGVFVLVQGVLSLRSSFLGLRFRNIGPLFMMKTNFVMIQLHPIRFHFCPGHVD